MEFLVRRIYSRSVIEIIIDMCDYPFIFAQLLDYRNIIGMAEGFLYYLTKDITMLSDSVV